MSVRPAIRRFHSPDAESLETYVPPDVVFAVLVQVMIGPQDAEGEESFDVLVCSPDWLDRECSVEPLLLEQMVCTRDFDWLAIRELIERRVSAISGATWTEVALKLDRIGRWEFADYDA
jgi:hypothetical protein